LRQLVAERFVGFVECLPRYGVVVGEFLAHANGLGTLAGE
jgi:hypothetical protein